ICATGIRVSELKYITLEVLKDGRADVNMKGKLRVIIIPQELCKMLKRYAAEQKITSGSIFVTKTGRPLDRT
ncbi:MAG TPA: integrase, partial [Ruminococcus sp.]|nr:integrase [Ruminococcus sp.]